MTDSPRPDGTPPGSRVARALSAVIAVLTAFRSLRRRSSEDHPPVQPQGGPDAAGSDDPSERTVPSNRQAENLVAALLVLGAGCAFAFIAIYIVVQTNTQLLGLAMGLALAFLAAAAIVAGKLVVPQENSVEPRDELLDEPAAKEVLEIFEAGGEGISRRLLLTGASGLAGAAVLGAAAAPLASLGPPAGSVRDSPWRRGIRFVDDQGSVYAASDIQLGSFYTALPQGENPDSLGAGLLVIRLPESMIHLPAARRNWAPQGIMAYSKICPHAACAINLYRYPLDESTTNDAPAFTCPCHYSTFTPGDGGTVIFGPAGRSLPQLPVMIDTDGNLRAAGEFDQDIGPSWWGVRRT